MVNHRTAVVSQIRGLLLDRGMAMAKSITRARRCIPDILADPTNDLTALAPKAIAELYDLFRDLDRRIASFDKKIELIFLESEPCASATDLPCDVSTLTWRSFATISSAL